MCSCFSNTVKDHCADQVNQLSVDEAYQGTPMSDAEPQNISAKLSHAGTNNYWRHSFWGRHLIFGLQCLSVMNTLSEILWLTVIPEVADQPCLHRGLGIQRSIREYFSLLARKKCVWFLSLFSWLTQSGHSYIWIRDLKKHRQCPCPESHPGTIRVFGPVVMDKLEMWVPWEETPVDGGG